MNEMEVYRNILAVMAAMMIASPLCCCSLPAVAEETTCCSHGTSTDRGCPGTGRSCPDCGASDPLLAEAGKAAPLKIALPELAPLSLFAVVPILAGGLTVPLPAMNLPDSGPPGWRLVRHQIFLI